MPVFDPAPKFKVLTIVMLSQENLKGAEEGKNNGKWESLGRKMRS